MQVFAIGYSNRTRAKFVKIIAAHGITLVADVRSIPRSRHQPGFNKDAFRKFLSRHDIKYLHFKGLGGLRKSVQNSANAGWINKSFRGFADYMQTREFKAALKELAAIAIKERIVLMCAEGNPFRCHRSLIADALTVRGISVCHISSAKSCREHLLTPFAKAVGKRITYPA